MRRYATSLTRALLLLVLSGTILHGGDFWEEKPFTEWSEEELLKLLTKSPWAKSVEFPVGPLVNVVRAPLHLPRRGVGRPGVYRRGGTATRFPPTATVHLRWVSALPVAQALARTRLGSAFDQAPGADRGFARQQRFHILAVYGLPAFVLQGALQGLRLRTSLKIKGRDSIHPDQVRGDGSGANGNIRFLFPKDQAGGHTISMDDKEVEFRIKFDKTTVKKKFKLKDMMYQGRLEI